MMKEFNANDQLTEKRCGTDRLDIQKFEQWLRKQEKSESTIKNYVQALSIFERQYAYLSEESIRDFKQSQLERCAPGTARLRCYAMNKYCEFSGHKSWKVKGVKISKTSSIDNVITIDEYHQLLIGLKNDGNEKLYWMIRFLAGTGARASELVSLKYENLSTCVCRIMTKGKVRTIMIPRKLVKESREYFDAAYVNNPIYLFPNRYGNQMQAHGLSMQLLKYGLRYGIRREVLHPHAFRHFFAIQFLRENGNLALLSDLLGHESISTTAIYLKLSEAEQLKQIDETVWW